ncbi:MAG: hypothetical protein ACI4U9_03575 [Clostridia bacterium]
MSAVKATAGIAGLGTSLYYSYDAMRDYSEGTKTAEQAIGQLAISIGGATASGAILGSVIPRCWNCYRCNDGLFAWRYFSSCRL